MPNKNDILQYLSLLSEFWPSVKGAFRRRTPAEKLQQKLDKLDREASKYRDRYARGKLTDERLATLLASIEKRREELAEE